MSDLDDIIEVLEELCEENNVPKNIKERCKKMIESLRGSEELSVKINTSLHELDEIGDDSNLQPFVRTQVWNVVSMLEKIKP